MCAGGPASKKTNTAPGVTLSRVRLFFILENAFFHEKSRKQLLSMLQLFKLDI